MEVNCKADVYSDVVYSELVIVHRQVYKVNSQLPEPGGPGCTAQIQGTWLGLVSLVRVLAHRVVFTHDHLP